MNLLRDYQIDDLAFYMTHPRCGNLSDPGTGKTPSVCVYAQYLWDENHTRTAWAMPKSLLKKNQDELLHFTEFREEDIQIIDGTPKQRVQQLASGAKIFLMGFDRWSSDWDTFQKAYPDLKNLLVDEIHMGWGHDNSKRTQRLYRSMRRMDTFLAMTGTLINGRLDSAYPTIHVIEPRYYPSYWGFKEQHAIVDLYGNIIGWQNHDKLSRIFARHTVRHTFEEVYGKESKVIEKRLCPMSPQQRKAFDEFEEKALLELEDTYLEGGIPGVHAIRCRQIMAHPETFGIAAGERTGKDEQLLIDLADHKNSGEPFCVYAALKPEQERIFQIIQKEGMTAALLNGDTSAKKRGQIDEDFRAGKIDVIVASPQVASVGFNWGHLNHMAFASIDYMDSSFVQAYRRGIRGKRSKPLRISVYEYERSIDQRMFAIVEQKSREANEVDQTYKVLNLSSAA